MEYLFSHMVNSMHAEDVKLLMKQSSGKNMISFAGGMPNNDIFPLKQIDEIYNTLPDNLKKSCFQYGPTSGYPPFVNTINEYLKKKGLPVADNRLLITTGSLQAISIITQEFVNKGDIILTENPCFVGALTVFETYGAEIHGIPVDKDGIDIEVALGAIDGKKFPARLTFIAPKGTEESGAVQFKIKADVTLDKGYFIRAGYSANADIVLEKKDSVLSIKESLLQFDKKEDIPYVEVKTGDQEFERRDIKLGISDGINVEIDSGLTADDEIKIWNKVKGKKKDKEDGEDE